MKRFARTGLLLPLFAILAVLAQKSVAAEDCTINFYLGEVQVRPAGAANWAVAEMGQALVAGDVIRTMVESRVELEMSDGTTVELGENAFFEVKKLDGARQQRSFKMLSGKVVANVKKLTKSRSEFQIESPVAIAAVRGTKFSMHVKQGGKTDIAVQEGRVEVKMISNKRSVAVTANQVITVTDKAFEVEAIETEGTKDEVPPKLNMESPEGGSIIKDGGVKVKGSTEATAKVAVNGEAVTVDKAGAFEKDLTLKEEGTHSITVAATDTADNVMEMILDVMLNSSSPEITLTSSAGDTTAAEVTTVNGTVTDKTPDDVLAVKFNGEDIELTEGTFSKTIRLQDGDNAFTAEATDLAGNAAKAELKVKRVKAKKTVADTEAPVVIIESPAAGTETEELSVEVTGSVTDNYPAGELKASIVVGGKSEALALVNGKFRHTAALTDGQNSISVTVTDKAGNKGSAAVRVKLNKDKSQPRVTISSSVGTETVNPNCVISGNVSDNGENTDLKASIKAGDKTEALDVTSGMYRYQTTLKSGQNTFTVTVTDKAGNAGTAAITVVLNDDKEAPRVTIRSSAGENTTEPVTNISGTVTDKSRLVELKATIAVNGKSEVLDVTSGTYSHMAQLEEGQGGKEKANKITVTVTDKAGNTGTAELTVTRGRSDINPPILVVQTGDLNEFTNLPTLRISGNVQDIESRDNPEALAKLRVTVGGVQVELNSGTFTHTVYLEDGKNNIAVIATDAAGNQTTENVFKFFDRLPPRITITRPSPGLSFPNIPGNPDIVDKPKTFLVTGFVEDDDPSSGIQSITVNGTAIEITNDLSFEYEIRDIKGTRSGNYPIEVIAIDKAGNQKLETRTLILD